MATTHLNGTTMQLAGELPVVGSMAPDFTLVAADLSEIKLNDYNGKKLVLNIFPSLDTPVCAASVRRFNQEVAAYQDTSVLCVSMDLPFAASRFCTVEGIANVKTASAYRSDFGETYGVKIIDGPMKGLLARALVVIDTDGRVLATSLCSEITEEPDYEMVKKVLQEN